MHTIHKFLLVGGLGLLLPFGASAQSITDLEELSPEDRRNYMESMSPEEREGMREKWRSEYENLSDEDKQAF